MMGKSNSKDACPASMARVFREIGFDKTSLLVNTLSNASKMVETNASATEDRAKRYLKDVKRFVKVVAGWSPFNTHWNYSCFMYFSKHIISPWTARRLDVQRFGQKEFVLYCNPFFINHIVLQNYIYIYFQYISSSSEACQGLQKLNYFTSFPSFTAYFTNSCSEIIIHARACDLWQCIAFFLLPESYNRLSLKFKIDKVDLISLSS